MERLRIGAVDVPVVTTRLENSLGEYQSSPVPTILIDSSLPPIASYMALVHEVIHAMSDQYSLNFSESTVRVLETAFCQLCRDHPDTMRTLAVVFGEEKNG